MHGDVNEHCRNYTFTAYLGVLQWSRYDVRINTSASVSRDTTWTEQRPRVKYCNDIIILYCSLYYKERNMISIPALLKTWRATGAGVCEHRERPNRPLGVLVLLPSVSGRPRETDVWRRQK